MASKPSPALARAMAASPSLQPTKDKLETIQAYAEQARDLELEIENLSEEIKKRRETLNDIYGNKLPMLMDEAHIDSMGVPPKGNKKGADFELGNYYSASIASSWAEEKKEEAFGILKKYKAEDLIKTEVSAKLPKGSLKKAKALVTAAKKLGIVVLIKKSVHAGTLTAWVKEIYIDKKKTLPKSDLEKIGGSVGRIVRLVDRKEDL